MTVAHSDDPAHLLPRVIAHRGASATHPENTLAAFDAAIAEGCDGIELDVQLSRDGVPLIYHDGTLQKIGGGSRPIRRVEAQEITGLDAGRWLDARHAGTRVPTLDQVLSRYARRTRLLLELKVRPGDRQAGHHVRLAEIVTERIRIGRWQTRVMVLCFDLETLALVGGSESDIHTALNLKAPRRVSRAFRQAVTRVSALSIDVRTIGPRIVEAVHAEGKPVLSYTCNTERDVRRAVLAGADGVMSDRPGWLRETMAAIDAPARRSRSSS